MRSAIKPTATPIAIGNNAISVVCVEPFSNCLFWKILNTRKGTLNILPIKYKSIIVPKAAVNGIQSNLFFKNTPPVKAFNINYQGLSYFAIWPYTLSKSVILIPETRPLME